jgi:hypothetical protein
MVPSAWKVKFIGRIVGVPGLTTVHAHIPSIRESALAYPWNRVMQPTTTRKAHTLLFLNIFPLLVFRRKASRPLLPMNSYRFFKIPAKNFFSGFSIF